MSSRRGPPTNLSIYPPSPPVPNLTVNTTTQALATPTLPYAQHPTANTLSPRRAPLPPSPTYSTHSMAPPPWLDRSRSNSLDVPRPTPGVPLPPGPALPPNSPHRGKGGYAGAYDNKLVSSTLSHPPSLPPLSPTPTGSSTTHSNLSNRHHSSTSPHFHPPSLATSFAGNRDTRPSFSPTSTSPSVVLLPDGTALPTGASDLHDRSSERADSGNGGRTVLETMAHSSPSSPWSLLTVHVLPLFAGGPLRTPVEDLNQLCHSHIIATSQRAQASRIVQVLTSDFRDFAASGMLTLKAKFDTLEEAKIIGRAAEVWSFFWAQVLPYLEGVFLPFSQVRDVQSTHKSHTVASVSTAPIPVRRILLSGFLVHILLPLLPRIVPIISSLKPVSPVVPPPTTPDLQRLLQMSLVLSTQARYSLFLAGQERRDEEVRLNVENLGKAVGWRMQRHEIGSPTTSVFRPEAALPPTTNRLSRGPSMSNGRHRRKGWRASTHFGQSWGQPPEQVSQVSGTFTRQHSDSVGQAPEQRWGRPRVDEEDEDDVSGGVSVFPKNTMRDEGVYGQSQLTSTFDSATTLASTVRAGDRSVYDTASSTASTVTPGGESYPLARPRRADSTGIAV